MPLRTRADGWTVQRQAAFLVALARSGSVSAAARAVGMSRESAYRLRRHPCGGNFAATWDAVLGGGAKRKLTVEERMRAALDGRIKPIVRRGDCAGTVRRADNSALLALLRAMPCRVGDDAL